MRTSRRGFTLLELVLAVAMASLVVIAGAGMFLSLQRQDARLRVRYESIGDMSRVQTTLRRAMQTIVAAPDADEDTSTSNLTGDPNDASAQLQGIRDNSEARAFRTEEGIIDIEQLAERGLHWTNPFRFAVGPFRPQQLSRRAIRDGDTPPGFDESIDFEDAQRLEVVLSQSPLAAQVGLGGPVRGAFDIVRDGEAGWTMRWIAIEPAAEPVTLAEGMTDIFWAVLPRGNWTDVYGAEFAGEIPRAVRVVMVTPAGEINDWMFEPGYTVGEPPQ